MNSLTKHPRPQGHRKGHSAGFTLVEMLVSVALVLLMMTLFAQVFQIAAGTVSTQRGIMENDQRARSIQTIITKDLNNRTYRYVWPWAARPTGYTDTVNTEESDMLGYFYISENNPFDDTDDVLQFTGKITATVNSLADTDSYSGRALQVGNSLNQPDYDDGDLGNLSSLSSTAEISLFMRRGTTGRPGALYRRVMLVREPADSTAEIDPHNDGNTTHRIFDPNSSTTTPYYPTSTSSFWKDFDFSSRPIISRVFGSATPPDAGGVRFNTLDDLRLPTSRFGFEFADGTANAGKPKEFLSNVFFGRYTMEETSSNNFQYPFGATTATSPMNQSNTTFPAVVNPQTNVVDGLQHDSANGSRRGEDLLLANVVSFDVKVWDDFANGGLGAFVDIGGPGSVLYSANPAVSGNIDRRLNVNFGPGAANNNNVFDTWGPAVRLATIASDPAENPPFLPRRYIAAATASAYELPRFTSGTTAGAVLPELVGGVSSIPGDPVFFVRSGASAGTNNAAGATIPLTLPIVYGTPIFDGSVEWTPVDNRRPIRLIQITVRFLDPTSQQLRTVTMQCDLTP
ncbi:prepilin-type N-terminal cleavage/methylation domain-containing protein [Planctopirus hydrillae]|uniref:Prepilin-type N-terminal cleavage/methylation domain-containing protein n=1 Tax=Planctopirus hydrillae TaxID=1841610 RepID=A0A1C3EAS8_9PLAN|nr:prepilin-type N-terminal cleavage/methylation domain-containing protein [Planctopirus hydrillae]ODA30343.1 hypothetical protein A6X21_00195 [Planctopirus hydrillae]